MSEQTKKCRECQMDIPKKARRCPHCRKKQGIGLGGLLVVVMFIGITSSVVMSSLDDARDTRVANTYIPPVVSDFELGTYKLESEEFQYMSFNDVNLWRSFNDRTLLGTVTEGDIVEVIKHDPVEDYCLVKTDTEQGWVACGWLVKQ